MARPRWVRIICPGTVKTLRNCAIVSSTIAATFTFIRRTHDGTRLEMTESEPPHEDNRARENALMLGFFVVLVAAGVWLLATMADVRKAQDCAAQGRRNCATIEIPDRPR